MKQAYDMALMSITVDATGHLQPDVEFFAGKEVFSANNEVKEKLNSIGALLKEKSITHEYPHAAMQKTIIFRATEHGSSQWKK
jgi:isoleucyl-tRNA synthetase